MLEATDLCQGQVNLSLAFLANDTAWVIGNDGAGGNIQVRFENSGAGRYSNFQLDGVAIIVDTNTLLPEGAHTITYDDSVKGARSATFEVAAGGKTFVVAALTTVVNPNTAPVISGGATAAISVAENQTAVTDVQTTDDNDSESSGLSYTLSGGVDQGKFGIIASTGVLTFNTAPDFEIPTDSGVNNVYDVQVTVTDSGGLTDVQDIAVTVTDVDEIAPTLAQVTTVPTPANDTTPDYTFSSDEAGPITVGGNCGLVATTAVSGSNTITFNALAAGTHSNCTVTVTDVAGNASAPLSVTSFTIIGPATGLAATSGSGQSTTISTAFANPIVATVTDVNGNAVPGVTVNFAVPGSGASVTLSAASGTTDANGQVSITATANGTGGSYNVTASSAGLTDVIFALTNGQGANVISFSGPANTDFTAGSVGVSATASSGLAVSFASTTTPVCTVSGSTVTFVSVGTCSVTASQAGDANFVVAADVVQSFAISGDKVVTRTKAIVSNFVSRRVDRIISGTPDIASRLRRSGGNGFEGATGFSPIGLSGSGTLDNTKLAFSTSLRQVIGSGNARKEAQRRELGEMMALGEQSLLSQYNTGLQPGFDVWVKGSLDHAKSDRRKSDLGLLFVGADYHLSDTTLIGVLAQFDWSDEKDPTNSFTTDGKGWIAGPYLVTRLGKNLLFDGRAAYGQSNNTISPLGTYEDSFDTTRWLVSGTLTGDFNLSGWRFSPHVGVSYFEETQKAYMDGIGNNIIAQTVSLGRLTFGPEVSTSYTAGNGTVISPHIGIKGIWDFEKAQTIDLNTGLASGSDNDFRASIGAGISTQFNNGWLLSGEGHYDGIGDDTLEAYGGSVKLTVPLN